MNIREKVMYLYDYIHNLEEYRYASGELAAYRSDLKHEICCRKAELVSLLSLEEIKGKLTSFYHAYSNNDSFYYDTTTEMSSHLKTTNWNVKVGINTGYPIQGYNVHKVEIGMKMLNFKNQLCRSTILKEM